MRIVKTVEGLRTLLDNVRYYKLGFVPTMGALHDGHLSLIKKAQKVSDFVLVSIYVNPTQFDNKKDLKTYPRMVSIDIDLLEKNGVDVLFLPSDSEIYPEGLDTKVDVDLGGVENVLEGYYRKGHFDGMMEVVNRLLDIVQPDKLIMGQKDIQQFTIVKIMLKELGKNIELVMCETVREPHGLARSSRNEKLSPEAREKAGAIYKVLKDVKSNIATKDFTHLLSEGKKQLADAGLMPEYLAIVNADTFQGVTSYRERDQLIIATAARIDGVRLIDNVII